MTQEDKELLFKDLCARLPYGVKVNVIYSNENASSFRQRVCVEGNNELNTDIIGLYQHNEIDIKPHLFPMSIMTVRQGEEFAATLKYLRAEEIDIWTLDTYDWCNKNNFDYRGLIPKGLANDATGLNVY